MKKMFLMSALVFSLLPLWAVYHKIGDYDTGGYARCVIVEGNIAYVTAGDSGLVIFNISDPQQPTLLSTYDTPGSAYFVAVSDSLAYVADWDGLQIIDVSDPQNPVQIGSYDQPDQYYVVKFLAVAGNTAYLADYYHGLQIMDVSNPQNPVLLRLISCGYVHSVQIVDSLAYVAGGSGLLIYNIANPQSVSLVGFYNAPETVEYVTVAGNIAYLSEYYYGLEVLDITNPQNPILLSSYPCHPYSVTVNGGIAYVPDNTMGLLVLDVSNPQSLSRLGSYSTPNWASHVAVSGDYAYVANRLFGLQVIDVSNPQNPTLLGTYDPPDYTCVVSVTVVGGVSYLANNWSGFKIVDVTNPQNPFQIGSYSTPGDPGLVNYLAIQNSIAYVAHDYGLFIIDVSNPQSPSQLGFSNTLGSVLYVTVTGNLAYVAGPELGIFDVTDPQNPILLGSYYTSDARSVAVMDSLAYMADGASGLRIIDVHNPQLLYQMGFCPTAGEALSVRVAGGLACLACGNAGLKIIDVSDPASPGVVSTILPHATSDIRQCLMHDGQLYISDAGWNEISVYNISNPQFPALVSRYAWNLSTQDMWISGDILYTANCYSGLNIHDLTTIPVQNDDAVHYPALAFQMRNYPNPFNTETTISYTLPAKGQVCLEINNSKGQLVKRLINEPQAKGEHTLTWNGKDDNNQSVASGLYLCRITSAGKHESRKLLLLK